MVALTLHRGIAVPREEGKRVTAFIRANGLSGSEGNWCFEIPDIVDVRTRIEKHFNKPDLTSDEVFPSTPFRGLCASGTPSGAAYYALIHNFTADRNNHSLAIEFTADIHDVYVDPRDFLCAAFQFWDRESERHQMRQLEVLCELFGPAVMRYFNAVCRSKDQKYRIAMCNLASFDHEVVKRHFANTSVITGRHKTRFCSSFFVKAPIDPSRVNRIYAPMLEKDQTDPISLEGFIHGL